MQFKQYVTRKRVIWGVVIVCVVLGGWFIYSKRSNGGNVQTAQVTHKDIKKTVLTTGQVVSSTDLSLSFQSSGVVRHINVKEGDAVRAGQVLATLDQGSVSASLESARGALAQAQANYDKVKAAATPQDIAVSQAAVDTASVALDNARQTLMNQLMLAYTTANNAILTSINPLYSNPQSNLPQFGISGTVQINSQMVTDANNDRVMVNGMLADWQNKVNSMTADNLDTITALSLSNLSKLSTYFNNIYTLLTVYTQLSGGSQTTLSTYQSAVASSKSSIDTAFTSITTYAQAVRSANSSLAQAKASLALKQSPARPEDVSIAEAQLISAQGQYNAALANFNNTVIVAPTGGTITQVNVKLGELATAQKEVFKLLNISELHTEAQVSEADIASIQIGQTIDNTFDALGPDQHFQSKVLTINPASTLVSGVVNYKVTGSLENIPGVKPGMTSNMTILVAEKKGVTVAPSSAIINREGKRYIRVIDDSKKKTYHEVEISTGLEADGGEVEILSGVASSTEVVTYVK